MSHMRAVAFVLCGLGAGLIWQRTLGAETFQSPGRDPNFVLKVVGSDDAGNAIYLLSRPGTSGCWIGVSAKAPVLLPAPELAGACR